MHRTARPVTSYDEELRTLVADMVATMYAADGVGLAACQIGVDLAVFVFDCPDDVRASAPWASSATRCSTLPEGRERRLDDGEEGCLSYPGAFVECARPDWATGAPAPGSTASRSVRGRRAARALPPARDRPHPRHRLRRPALDQARKKLRKKAHDKAVDDYPLNWPADS